MFSAQTAYLAILKLYNSNRQSPEKHYEIVTRNILANPNIPNFALVYHFLHLLPCWIYILRERLIELASTFLECNRPWKKVG